MDRFRHAQESQESPELEAGGGLGELHRPLHLSVLTALPGTASSGSAEVLDALRTRPRLQQAGQQGTARLMRCETGLGTGDPAHWITDAELHCAVAKPVAADDRSAQSFEMVLTQDLEREHVADVLGAVLDRTWRRWRLPFGPDALRPKKPPTWGRWTRRRTRGGRQLRRPARSRRAVRRRRRGLETRNVALVARSPLIKATRRPEARS